MTNRKEKNMKEKVRGFREPVNALTHLIGMFLSVAAAFMMYLKIVMTDSVNPLTFISVTAFSVGLICLYYGSYHYHAVWASASRLLKLKKLDHAMIFLLIAGSYTPFCLLGLTGFARTALLSAIWITASAGILMMVFWIDMPRWLNTFLYIFLGWFAIFAIVPLYYNLPAPAFALLLVGGIFYTIGGVIYGLKKPNGKILGFHEIFHIFVLLGSAAHVAAVLGYLI